METLAHTHTTTTTLILKYASHKEVICKRQRVCSATTALLIMPEEGKISGSRFVTQHIHITLFARLALVFVRHTAQSL